MLTKLSEQPQWPPLSPVRTGIRCRCPRCGEGNLFKGFLALAPACDVCGLDFTFADPADGPAFFVICFTCVPAILFGVWIEIAYSPPYWVHLVTSFPAILVCCIPPLRPLKGWLVCSQFFYKAEEGRFAVPQKPTHPPAEFAKNGANSSMPMMVPVERSEGPARRPDTKRTDGKAAASFEEA